MLQPLLERIENQSVTFIQGPAGSGKTVLLEQALKALASRMPTARLSLASTPLRGSSIRASLLALFSRLSKGSRSFVIVVDDADELLGRADQRVLEECLVSLPPRGKLVIASRRRLMARQADGPVLELADLLFTQDEVRAALRRRGHSLDAASLMAVWRLSEGWPAVLALLCASDTDDQSLEPERLLMEWFQEELLDSLAPELLAFALEASVVVGRLRPELLDRMRGRPGSWAQLHRLVVDHGLLIRGHERFPRPLASTLRRLHSSRSPLRVRELHRAALETLLAEGEPEAALEHAYRMGDRSLLLRLLKSHSRTLLLQGRMRSLRRWLTALDREGALGDDPGVHLTLAWSLLFSKDQQAAQRMIERLREWPLTTQGTQALRALELTWLSMRDQVDEARLCLAAFERVPVGDGFSTGVGQCTATLVRLLLEDLAIGGAHLDRCLPRPDASGGFVAAYARSLRAMHCLMRADTVAARDHLRLARHGLVGEEERARGNSLVATLDAVALYETGELDQAGTLLELHLPLLRQGGMLDQIILAHKLYARIALRRGDHDIARDALTSLECLGRARRLPRMMFSARLEWVRCALVRGDLALARERLEAARDPEMDAFVQRCNFPSSDTDTWYLMSVRLALASDAAEGLDKKLAGLLEQAERVGRERRALTLRILLAQALEQNGHPHAARRAMQDALLFAAPRGLSQAFRDEGRRALKLAFKASEGVAGVSSLREVLVEGSGLEDAPEAPTVALTNKELQVLALVAGGQSNGDLARRLFVSESTVRTHLRSINVKLNARSRLEALAIARRQGLITA
ncbi:LuxR C-terminal-related transcriptional regulator [Marinobacter sp. NFXS9]|uniref:LuxR C-terminal-related transcriptional regulator n=1 Tax=Marinobacter sp. NFXS9 TaxID=2818433 RepID=UPI0032DF15A7